MTCHHESFGNALDEIGVIHKGVCGRADALIKQGVCVNGGLCLAVLTDCARSNFSAKGVRHKLHAIANAKDGHAKVKERLVCVEGVFLIHAVRTASEDNADGVFLLDTLDGGVTGHNHTHNFECTDFSCDELFILTAEIKDNNFLDVVIHTKLLKMIALL